MEGILMWAVVGAAPHGQGHSVWLSQPGTLYRQNRKVRCGRLSGACPHLPRDCLQ